MRSTRCVEGYISIKWEMGRTQKTNCSQSRIWRALLPHSGRSSANECLRRISSKELSCWYLSPLQELIYNVVKNLSSCWCLVSSSYLSCIACCSIFLVVMSCHVHTTSKSVFTLFANRHFVFKSLSICSFVGHSMYFLSRLRSPIITKALHTFHLNNQVTQNSTLFPFSTSTQIPSLTWYVRRSKPRRQIQPVTL